MKKTGPRKMSAVERRRVLEAIARDENTYPRDRIAAVRTLEELESRRRGQPVRDGLDRTIDQILAGK